MSDDLARLVYALGRDVSALAGQVVTLRRELLEHRHAAGLAIDAITEQVEELGKRMDTVHRAALRTATDSIKPRGAA